MTFWMAGGEATVRFPGTPGRTITCPGTLTDTWGAGAGARPPVSPWGGVAASPHFLLLCTLFAAIAPPAHLGSKLSLQLVFGLNTISLFAAS